MTFGWLKRPGVAKAGRIAGYAAFGVAVFLVSVVLTFPTERLRSYLESRLSERGLIVRIEELSLRGLGSATLKGVKVELPAEVPPPGAKIAGGEDPAPVRRTASLDRVDVSLSLLRLLFGNLVVTFEATHGDGVLGPVKVVKTPDKVTVDVTEVKDFPLLPDLAPMGLRLSGRVNGRASIAWDLKDGLAGSTGRVDLTVSSLKALKPTLKSESQGNATLTDVDLGKMTIQAVLDKRSNLAAFKADRRGPGADGTVLLLEKVEVDGADVKALVESHSTIKPVSGRGLDDGQLSVELAFSLSDPFFDRTVTIGGEPQSPNRFLRTLLSMSPQWKTSQSGGYWGVMCSGTLKSPSCIPRRPSIRGGDFKAPAKEEETAAKGTSPASAPPATARPVTPASAPPVAPAAPAPPRPAPAPETESAPAPVPASTEPPAVSPTVIGGAGRQVLPTVIGRPKARIREMEGDEEPPAEGQGAPAGREPAQAQPTEE